MALLAVSDLSVTFQTSTGTLAAVRGLTFSVDPGEVVGVIGESGSGKTLAMAAIAGLLPPGARAAGSVTFGGRELLGAAEDRWREVRGAQIGFVFQDPLSALNPTLPVGHQVAEVVERHLHLRGRAARERAIALLEAVDLPDPARRAQEYPHQWSGGMRQRALIAMALAARPALLIADEPTSALDAGVAAEVSDLLLRLQAEMGLAVLVTSHDLGLIARLADRVLVVYAGAIVESGTSEDVLLRRAHPYTEALMAALPGRGAPGEPLPAIPGEHPRAEGIEPGCAFAPRCRVPMRGCVLARPALLPVPGGSGHAACCWRLHPQHPDAPPAGGAAHAHP